MKEDFWRLWRELQYKNINKMIIIEEFLEDNETKIPVDYKFFCFNWKPEFIQLDLERFVEHKRNIYDLSWNKLDFWILYNTYDWEVEKPEKLEKMIEYAWILSKDFSFVRVDFYEVNWEIYFGEITFTPWNWLEPFFPNHYELDKKFWELILLNK
jgi:hypothetical protein